MVIEGADFAFPPRPSASALVSAGKHFVVRYGGPGTEDKWLHADEAAAYAAAGIVMVANAEGGASGLRGGFSAGASWARSADNWFRSIGMPAGRPIYLSVDFDTTSGDWDELDAAMDGAASEIGRARVGVYGEYDILVHLAGNGKAKWFWQTYAWSSGKWFSGNHLEQYKNRVLLGGVYVDLCRARQSDYGQWVPGIGGDDVFCNWGDKLSPNVRLLQRRIIRAGGDLSGVGGVDGNYGNGTAGELAKLIGGDGKAYDDAAADMLDEILRMKTATRLNTGTKGDKGDPGLTPTKVRIAGVLDAEVTEYAEAVPGK
jgi:hypothetical protein